MIVALPLMEGEFSDQSSSKNRFSNNDLGILFWEGHITSQTNQIKSINSRKMLELKKKIC